MLPVDKPVHLKSVLLDLIHYAASDDYIIAELQLDLFSFHNKFAVYHLAIRFPSLFKHLVKLSKVPQCRYFH